MFLILLAITFVLRLPAFFVPVFNSDETFVATQAHVIEEGGELYEDATDRKPPLVPYIYAGTFAFFGTSALWSVRVVAMLAVALTALLLAVEARRRWGSRAGWIAGVLFVLAMVAFAPQDGQAANFEVFMLPSMTAAILFARRGRGAAAGVAIAFATLAKQTGAATLLPVLYLLARATRQARGRAGRARVRVPVAIVALVVGPGQLLYWAVLGNGSYLGVQGLVRDGLAMFVLMTSGSPRATSRSCGSCPSAWHDRRLARARRRERHRPVAVARRRGDRRSRSACASSATTTCSSCRRSRCSPPARCRERAPRVTATIVAASLSRCVLGRRLLPAPVRRPSPSTSR